MTKEVARQGQTKYVLRAKLQFFDGGYEFLVDADAIAVSKTSKPSDLRRSSSRPTCWTCCDRHDGVTICPDCGQED